MRQELQVTITYDAPANVDAAKVKSVIETVLATRCGKDADILSNLELMAVKVREEGELYAPTITDELVLVLTELHERARQRVNHGMKLDAKAQRLYDRIEFVLKQVEKKNG